MADDDQKSSKRSRFDQTEPQVKRSRFDRRSRSPRKTSENGRSRSPLPSKTPLSPGSGEKKTPSDAAAAAGRINVSLLTVSHALTT